MKRLRSHAGFTLFEILIALGILAGATVALMGGVGTAVTYQTRDEEMLQAVHLATSKMAEVEAEIQAEMEKGSFPDDLEKSEKFEGDFEKYEYTYTLKKVEIPVVSPPGGGEEGQNANMQNMIKTIMKDISEAVRELKLTVTWVDDEDEKPRDVTLTTHLVNLK